MRQEIASWHRLCYIFSSPLNGWLPAFFILVQLVLLFHHQGYCTKGTVFAIRFWYSCFFCKIVFYLSISKSNIIRSFTCLILFPVTLNKNRSGEVTCSILQTSQTNSDDVGSTQTTKWSDTSILILIPIDLFYHQGYRVKGTVFPNIDLLIASLVQIKRILIYY